MRGRAVAHAHVPDDDTSMKVDRTHRRRPSLRTLLPPAPRAPKPGPLADALDQRLKATVERLRSESQQAAIDFLGAKPSDSARPLGKAGSIKVTEADDDAAPAGA